MRRRKMLKFTIAVATVLVAAVIIYGALQADDEFNRDAATPTAMPVATTTIAARPTPTPVAIATTTDPVVLPGSVILFQVRGGDNPCRYLSTSNRVGTFAGGQITLVFVAGTHDTELAATDEMHLYGDTGPHLFEIEDARGNIILNTPVGRGATVQATVVLPDVALYKLYDRLFDQAIHVSEIFARPIGQAGYAAVTGWCPPEESAP